jgi:hypothetical protein
MLYEQTFLDRADLQKFQMFAAIKDTNVQTYTINTLSQHLDLSYQQGYNILQELFRDLTVLNKTSRKNETETNQSSGRYRYYSGRLSSVFVAARYRVPICRLHCAS